ncbi:mitochondria-eating protein isoform X2 [Vidua macroura]|uniref:mitochondria-eating protein isoform X2 n=1 Tax=Vidua macroura TaxID=187451 RepID=UPI0023A87997|nr:mitochondria-eating protein isoform X2 [Vidua macroura]
MAKDLKSLVGAGSVRELQQKLESWQQNYEMNSAGENLSRCCEILELNTAIQKQLFSILNETSQGDECAAKIKSCLLPSVCCAASGSDNLTQDSAEGELQLRDLACKPKCELQDLEDKLSETCVQINQMERDLKASRIEQCSLRRLQQLDNYEQKIEKLRDEIAMLDCRKSVIQSRLARTCSPSPCRLRRCVSPPPCRLRRCVSPPPCRLRPCVSPPPCRLRSCVSPPPCRLRPCSPPPCRARPCSPPPCPVRPCVSPCPVRPCVSPPPCRMRPCISPPPCRMRPCISPPPCRVRPCVRPPKCRALCVRPCSPPRFRRGSASHRACLIARFNFIYAKERLEAEAALKRYFCDSETVQKIIYIAAVESFRAAKTAFWKVKINVKDTLAVCHRGGPSSLEVAVLDYIACHKDLYDVCSSVHEVVCAMNKNPKLPCPGQVDIVVISALIRELCCLAFSMQTLIPPLDIAFGIDGECFNKNMYYRSFDSDFTAPFVAYHVWPALIEDGTVIVKGEVVTKKMVTCPRRCRIRSRSCSCGRPLLCGQVPRSRSLSTVRVKRRC